jgi:metal-sulfur cluster biosynthetic enzyme
MTAVALAERVREALRLVLDPELGENVVDLGLIYAVDGDDDGGVRVTMTTTTPGCPAAAFLVDGVRECARAVAGVSSAHVLLTYEPPWTPALMSAAVRARLQGGGQHD